MAQQFASSAFPSIANDPRALRVDPFGIPGLYPTKDLLLIRPDVLAATDAFARSTAAYRTMDSGLLQSVAAGGLRIDHDPALGTNLGALFEEARTNLVTYSNAFSAASWSLGSGSSVTQNATGPDGVANSAWTAVLSSSGPGLYQAVPYSANTSYYASIWMRVASGTAQVAIMSYNSGAPNAIAQVTVTTAWQRFSVPWNGGGSNSTVQYFELRTDQVSSPASATVQIFGAQIEQGTFPTSYIPTGSGAVARAADTLVAPVTSDWFNPAEGTLYVDAFVPAGVNGTAGYSALVSLDDGTASNLLGLYLGNDGAVHAQNGAGGKYPDVGSGALGLAAGASLRVAMSYNASTLLLSVNGAPAVSVAIGSGGLAASLANLRVGAWAAGGGPFSGRIRRAAYIARAQTAAVLQAMTTTLPTNLPVATAYRPGLMSPADKAALAQAGSDVAISTQNILYQGLLIAALRNVPTGLVDGILDPFSSTADVNTSKSSGYTFSSSAGTIGATVTGGGPVQTSAQAIANGAQGSYPASQAFDSNTSTFWYGNETGTGVNGVSWIGQDFGAGNAYAIQSLTLTQYDNGGSTEVTSALLEYADSPSGPWTTAATINNLPKTAAQQSYANNLAGGSHRCWRLRANSAVAGTNNSWGVSELTLTAPSTAAAMTLQSATLASAVASPSAMRLLIQVDSTSAAFAPNTDSVVKLSRDGGTTFTAATLALVQAMPDGTAVYDTGWLSVTGQPVGNSTMTYLITTPTNKAIVLTGVSMQVRP